jgi:hypothetical protein
VSEQKPRNGRLWASLSTLTDTPNHVIVGSYLIAELAEHLDEAFIVDNLPIFVEFRDWPSSLTRRRASPPVI